MKLPRSFTAETSIRRPTYQLMPVIVAATAVQARRRPTSSSRDLRDQGFRRAEEACDRRRILAGRAGYLGRIDDAGFE